MAKKKLTAFVMSITPFDDKFRLDETAFRVHLRRLLAAGCCAYVGSSATGEAFSMTPEELDRVHAIAVEELKGKTIVRAAGFEPRRVEDMVRFVRRVEPFNLDAVHVSALELGHGARPTAAELEKYYMTVADSTSMPIIISSYEALNALLPISVLERLVERCPNIQGFFCGVKDLKYLADVIVRLGDRIEINCTGPYNAPTCLALGGNGYMGHEGNLSPVLNARIITAFESGDRALFEESFRKLMAVHAIHLKTGGVLRAMKPLLNAYGLPGGTVRPPRMAISDEELAETLAATIKLDLPGLPPPVMRH